MTSEEIALSLLKPIFEEMKSVRRELAASGTLDADGDAGRREAAHAIKLIDEIHNELENKIGINHDD